MAEDKGKGKGKCSAKRVYQNFFTLCFLFSFNFIIIHLMRSIN